MYRWTTLLIWAALLLVLPKLAYDDWQTLRQSAAKPDNASHKISTARGNNEQADVFDPALAANLFGEIQIAAPQIATEAVREFPVTRLNLGLVGTFTHASLAKASALISEDGKPSQRYFGNDTVAGSARLVAINKDSVVLRRNGRDEILRFPRISPLEGKSPDTDPPIATQPSMAARTGQVAVNSANTGTGTTTDRSTGLAADPPSHTSTRSALKERLKRLRERK